MTDLWEHNIAKSEAILHSLAIKIEYAADPNIFVIV